MYICIYAYMHIYVLHNICIFMYYIYTCVTLYIYMYFILYTYLNIMACIAINDTINYEGV